MKVTILTKKSADTSYGIFNSTCIHDKTPNCFLPIYAYIMIGRL